MGANVGSIFLDLKLNKRDFETSLNNVKTDAKRTGQELSRSLSTVKGSLNGFSKLMIAAFSIKALTSFGSSCLKLGSDLAEVQNVVDVTFNTLSSSVNKFAKNAAYNFGLSEHMAKQFTGTTGAMAKAFGFSEEKAYEMGTAIAGLSGDVASFYNLTQDEAFTKLKAIFTGETESLKSLGVVMTQNALDGFALANGFNKTTKAMTEQEKVALRYKFVLNQLKGASGDFLRTSDGWANQVRILKLQFESLKASIGAGIIRVLLPVVKVINSLIAKVLSLVNAFKSFKSVLGSGFDGNKKAIENIKGIEKASKGSEKALNGVGLKSKETAKKINDALSSIDELNIIEAPKEGGESVGGSLDEVPQLLDVGNLSEAKEKTESIDKTLKNTALSFSNLSQLFKDGFKIGFNDDFKIFDTLKENLKNVKKNIESIFNTKKVKEALNNFISSVLNSLGKTAGAISSLAFSIFDNLAGGINKYLAKNKGFIQGGIISLLKTESKKGELISDFIKTFSEISKVLRGESAKSVTASVIEIFTNSFITIRELFSKLGHDLLNLVLKPFIDNMGLINEALSVVFSGLAPVVDGVASLITESFKKIIKTYDSSLKPLIASLTDGISGIFKVLLDGFNKHFKPVIDLIGLKFNELSKNYLSPLIDKLLNFATKFHEAIKTLWENVLAPFISYLIEFLVPVFARTFEGLVRAGHMFVAGVSEALGGFINTLSGLLDFITGVFSGDFKKAFEGLKTFFIGIWETIKGLFKAVIGTIYELLKMKLLELLTMWQNAWQKVKNIFSKIWEDIKLNLFNIFSNIKNNTLVFIENIKTAFTNGFNNLKSTIKNIWDNIWGTIKGVLNLIIGGVESMVNSCIRAINSLIQGINDVVDKIPGVEVDFIPKIPSLKLPKLAQGGFVKANTPQLALIGDNKHQGEVVAPEGKMLEMAKTAAELVANKDAGVLSYEVIEVLGAILDTIKAFSPQIVLDVEELSQRQEELKSRKGFTLS